MPGWGFGVGGAAGPLEDLSCSNVASEGAASLAGSSWVSGRQLALGTSAALTLASTDVPAYIPGVGAWLQDDLVFSTNGGLVSGDIVLRVKGSVTTEGALASSQEALAVSFSLGGSQVTPEQRIHAYFDLDAATGTLRLNDGRSSMTRDARITFHGLQAGAVDIEFHLPYLLSSFDNGVVQTVSSTLSLHPYLGGAGTQSMNFAAAISSTFPEGTDVATVVTGRTLASAVPEPHVSWLLLGGLAGMGLIRQHRPRAA